MILIYIYIYIYLFIYIFQNKEKLQFEKYEAGGRNLWLVTNEIHVYQ